MKKLLTTISLCISFTLSSQVRINELMQSNIDYLMDDLFDFPDSWVELYNESDVPVNLKGWYIGAKKDYQKGWQIQKDTLIPGRGYLVIYCDKVEDGIHTDFRLETTKKSDLYLFDPSGTKIDEVKDVPAQPNPNIAYGRISDGSFHFLIVPTAGKENGTLVATQVTPSPRFEQQAGVYKTPVMVTLTDTSGIPNAKIHYTTDNSEPDGSAPIYTAPIRVDTTTVIRAKVIAENYLIPRSIAQTYIVSDRELTLPIISISTDNRYLWDDSVGIYCVGKNGKQYGEVIKANFYQNWRRPMIFSYFPSAESEEVLNQLGEIRIAGDGSRLYPSKSMIVYSHKRFGEKEFSYPIFQNPDKKDVIIKSMMLRNSGQDFMSTYLNDASNQLFMGGKVELDYQAYQPAILYLNGQYWGIINIRERSEEDYVYGNYNRLEDVDVLENWYDVKAGDNIEANRLIEGVNNDLFSYEELKAMVDLDEFINFSMLHMFVANRDYPINNVVMWRERKEGGKWRFIVKDTDLGGHYITTTPDFNALNYMLHPEEEQGLVKEWDWTKESALFRALMQSNKFRNEFINRFTVYLGNILSTRTTCQIVDSLKKQIDPEISYHINAHSGKALDYYFAPPTLEAWDYDIKRKKQWLSERVSYQYQHLNEYMSYGGLVDLIIESPVGELNEVVMQLNGVDLLTNQFDGMYYKGQTFTLNWLGAQSLLKGWQVTTVYENKTEPVVTTYFEPSIEIAVSDQVKSVRIQPITDISDANNSVDAHSSLIVKESGGIRVLRIPEKSIVRVFDLSGKNIYTGESITDNLFIPLVAKGVYIVQIQNSTDGVTKKIVY